MTRALDAALDARASRVFPDLADELDLARDLADDADDALADDAFDMLVACVPFSTCVKKDGVVPRRRVAATPRPRSGHSVETSRGDAAAATWIFGGDQVAATPR